MCTVFSGGSGQGETNTWGAPRGVKKWINSHSLLNLNTFHDHWMICHRLAIIVRKVVEYNWCMPPLRPEFDTQLKHVCSLRSRFQDMFLIKKILIALIYPIEQEMQQKSGLDNRKWRLLFLAYMQQLHESDTEHKNIKLPSLVFSYWLNLEQVFLCVQDERGRYAS